VTAGGQRLLWLEVMRGLAACWVLLGHARLSTEHFGGALPFDATFVGNGHLGVEFFFVLSGFIIAYSGFRLLESGRGLADYARARSIRIYVPYLPVGVAMLLLYAAFPDVSASVREPGVLSSLTLLPSGRPPALSVAWTLIHEVVFYALFATVFVSRRLLAATLLAWTAAIGWVAWHDIPYGFAWKYLVSPINLCFLAGVGTYFLVRRGIPAGAGLAAGLAGALAVGVCAFDPEPRRWLVTLGFCGLVIAAAGSFAGRVVPAKPLVLLGAASYAIYLVHNPALSAASRAFARIDGLAPGAFYALVATVALAAGLAYYLFYERHALDAVRARLAAARAAPLPAAAVPLKDSTNP
jgi:hypothetical protein